MFVIIIIVIRDGVIYLKELYADIIVTSKEVKSVSTFDRPFRDVSYWRVAVQLQKNTHSVRNSRYVECDSLILLTP